MMRRNLTLTLLPMICPALVVVIRRQHFRVRSCGRALHARTIVGPNGACLFNLAVARPADRPSSHSHSRLNCSKEFPFLLSLARSLSSLSLQLEKFPTAKQRRGRRLLSTLHTRTAREGGDCEIFKFGPLLIPSLLRPPFFSS